MPEVQNSGRGGGQQVPSRHSQGSPSPTRSGRSSRRAHRARASVLRCRRSATLASANLCVVAMRMRLRWRSIAASIDRDVGSVAADSTSARSSGSRLASTTCCSRLASVCDAKAASASFSSKPSRSRQRRSIELRPAVVGSRVIAAALACRRRRRCSLPAPTDRRNGSRWRASSDGFASRCSAQRWPRSQRLRRRVTGGSGCGSASEIITSAASRLVQGVV